MTSEVNSSHTQKSAFALITIVFLIWGSITSLNDVLVPHFKNLFKMNYTETMLIQFAFYGAYFLMSFPSSLIIDRIGYQKGIVFGLLVISFGGLLFLPASWIISYPLFLFGLFTLASGCVVLQVVATPYVSVLGPAKTASSRLNFAEGVNSLGTTFMPFLGAYLILGGYSSIEEQAAKVQIPYIGIAVIMFIMAIIFAAIKLPIVHKRSNNSHTGNILRFRQLRLGVIALTLYVGAEICVASFIVNFLGEPYIANLSEQTAAQYIPFYWGGLLIGRFIGSAILQKLTANSTLAWASIGAGILLAITLLANGYLAMWSMLGVGLFNSIMWSNIISLSLNDIGEYRVKASGILIMAAGGGAIFPVLQGVLADIPSIGIHNSYILPLSCYLFIFYYAMYGYKPNTKK